MHRGIREVVSGAQGATAPLRVSGLGILEATRYKNHSVAFLQTSRHVNYLSTMAFGAGCPRRCRLVTRFLPMTCKMQAGRAYRPPVGPRVTCILSLRACTC